MCYNGYLRVYRIPPSEVLKQLWYSHNIPMILTLRVFICEPPKNSSDRGAAGTQSDLGARSRMKNIWETTTKIERNGNLISQTFPKQCSFSILEAKTPGYHGQRHFVVTFSEWPAGPGSLAPSVNYVESTERNSEPGSRFFWSSWSVPQSILVGNSWAIGYPKMDEIWTNEMGMWKLGPRELDSCLKIQNAFNMPIK